MHALHKIVVKAETLQEAIEKAQDALEPYRMTAYDYYDEDGGPNWGEDYARPLCSAEDQEKILELLLNQRETQRAQMLEYLEFLSGNEQEPSATVFFSVFDEGGPNGLHWLAAMGLKSASRLAVGDHSIESGFFDCINDTAKVTEDLLRDIEHGNENHWMLFFDLHF